MVRLLVEGLGGDRRTKPPTAPVESEPIEVYHVDARLSDSIDDIGQAGGKKVALLFWYTLQAIWCRLRHGVRRFYYVPAPGRRAAVYRDWMVMAMCRPFFPVVIYHWHAIGLGEWIETHARPWERWISRRLLARPELSLVLGEFNRRDARQLESKQVVVVPNGIPDPCPSFDDEVRPQRVQRAEDRKALLTSVHGSEPPTGARTADTGEFRVMFIGLCHREKGLFDAVEAIALANRHLLETPLRLTLAVAGGFWHESERVEFEQRVRQPDLFRDGRQLVEYRGFVHGAEKQKLFRESDCLCFPTYYPAESFGLVVVEAMAWGLHVVTTRWQTVPELLPPGYSGLVAPQSPAELAAALVSMASADYDVRLRRRFVECLTERRFIDNVRGALATVGRQG